MSLGIIWPCFLICEGHGISHIFKSLLLFTSLLIVQKFFYVGKESLCKTASAECHLPCKWKQMKFESLPVFDTVCGEGKVSSSQTQTLLISVLILKTSWIKWRNVTLKYDILTLQNGLVERKSVASEHHPSIWINKKNSAFVPLLLFKMKEKLFIIHACILFEWHTS